MPVGTLPQHIMNDIENQMPWDLFAVYAAANTEGELIRFEDSFSDVFDIDELIALN